MKREVPSVWAYLIITIIGSFCAMYIEQQIYPIFDGGDAYIVIPVQHKQVDAVLKANGTNSADVMKKTAPELN